MQLHLYRAKVLNELSSRQNQGTGRELHPWLHRFLMCGGIVRLTGHVSLWRMDQMV